MSKTGRPSERGSISSISSTPLPSAQNQLKIEPHRYAQSLRSLRRIRGHWGSTRPRGSACSRSLPQMERLNAACRRRETTLRRTRNRARAKGSVPSGTHILSQGSGGFRAQGPRWTPRRGPLQRRGFLGANCLYQAVRRGHRIRRFQTIGLSVSPHRTIAVDWAHRLVSHDAQNLVVALRRAAASDRYRSQPRAEEHRRQSSDADLHGPSWPIRLERSRLADQRPEWPIRLVRSRLARPEFTVPAELGLPSAGGVGVSRAASYGR